ncbi:MAG: ABC transporter substrate-binding protein, partial [Planctomycetota bacterium]
MMQFHAKRVIQYLPLFVCALGLLGCGIRLEDSVVVYSAADREYAAPILAGFSRRNEGVEIAPVFDVESTKTVGLVSRIESEANRPRCDVFWNNEIMHTLRLQQAGMLKPIAWQIPGDWPSDMRSADSTWLGIAARARILLVNRDILPKDGQRPNSVLDLADPKWQKRCAVAAPLFGTTATHFALLQVALGEDEANQFF